MIVIADPTIGIFRYPCGVSIDDVESAATMMNLAVARKHFEKLERWDTITDIPEKSNRNGIKKS